MTLSQSVSKNIFETTLCCTVVKVYETVLSITRGDLELLQHADEAPSDNCSQRRTLP